MTKEQLQIALEVETAIKDQYDAMLGEEELGWTQHNTLNWHQEQRTRAIHRVAAEQGWQLDA